MMPLPIENDVPLAPLTTIHLGGPARFLVRCSSIAEIGMAIAFAREKSLRVVILGGGSNLIFADAGFRGLVLQPLLRGISVTERDREVVLTARAGEIWDDVVRQSVTKGYGGLECLSGIPGLVGAAPLQNVGAYGQEVADTILSVGVLDRSNVRELSIDGDKCGFGYRQSIFKAAEKDRYIITSVTFRLRAMAEPGVKYAELRQLLESRNALGGAPPGEPALSAVRDAVLTLRAGKSMVVNHQDPHSRSVGSFFMNPLLTQTEFEQFLRRARDDDSNATIPSFVSGDRIKVPAAWLVEHAGFPKGFRRGNVGLSERHALALVNYGGTTAELLRFAEEIRNSVQTKFGMQLELEPVVIPAA